MEDRLDSPGIVWPEGRSNRPSNGQARRPIIPTGNGLAAKLADVESHFTFFLTDGEFEEVPAGAPTTAYQMARLSTA
jgi:hypothetical protein